MSEQSMGMVEQFQESLTSPMMALWTKVAEFLPNLLAAALLILFGYLLAKLLCVVISKILARLGVDSVGEKSGLKEVLASSNLQNRELSELLGTLVFWLIMLTFIMSAAEALGLPQVSATVDKFVFFLPKVLAAAVVLLVGLFIAQFVRAGILTLAHGMEAKNAQTVSSIVYGFLVVLISTLAIAQLDVDVQLLNNVISIALISLGAGFALAVGLGGKDIASDVLGKMYKKKTPRKPAKKPA